MLYAQRGNLMVRAEPGGRATCPGCAAAVIAKCGSILIWHWSHEADRGECDPWFEGETDWHLAWKQAALDAGCRVEVTMRDQRAWHRADIVRPDGVVIELQHSTIGQEEVLEREAFYRRHGGLLWLWDAGARWWPQLQDAYLDGAGEAWWGPRPSPIFDVIGGPFYWDTSDGIVCLRRLKFSDGGAMLLALRDAHEEELFGAPAGGIQPAEAWRWGPGRCATCGSEPTGRYPDGSPRYGCYDPSTHRPIWPVNHTERAA